MPIAVLRAHRIAAAVPGLKAEDAKRLADALAEHGLKEPITLFEDRILDGRARYAALRRAKYEFKPEDFAVHSGDYDTAVQLVWNRNVVERNLPVGPRALVAVSLFSVSPTSVRVPETLDARAVAARFGVPPTNVRRAANVLRNGIRELVRRAVLGEISLSRASEIAAMGPNEQDVTLREMDAAINRAAAVGRRGITSTVPLLEAVGLVEKAVKLGELPARVVSEASHRLSLAMADMHGRHAD